MNTSTTEFDRLPAVKEQFGPKRILDAALTHAKLPHAMLFTGMAGVGKRTTARELVRVVHCTHQGPNGACGTCESCRRLSAGSHPDLLEMHPEGTAENYKIDQIRELIDRASLTTGRTNQRFVILADAHRLTEEAANCFLKFLEEPPPSSTIILTTTDPQTVLPTIRSRCFEVPFTLLSERVVYEELIRKGVAQDQAHLFARLAQGSLGNALEWINADWWNDRNWILDLITTNESRGWSLKAAGTFSDALKQMNQKKENTDTEQYTAERQEPRISPRERLLRLLSTIQVFFRDIAVAKVTGSTQTTLNMDRNEAIATCARTIRWASILRVFDTLNTTHDLLAVHISPQHVLCWLLSEIECIQNGEPPTWRRDPHAPLMDVICA